MARKLTKTQRLRRHVQRTIKSLENRGYYVPPEIKEKVATGKYQTLESIHRNKYAKLYRESTAEIDGEIVSGEIARVEERRRRLVDADWERRRAEQDRIDMEKAKLLQEGEIVMYNVEALIAQYPTNGAKFLSKMLAYEIGKYGRDNVEMALASAPEASISYAKTIVYYENSKDVMHSALQEFADMIRGTIPTAEESREIGEVMDEL